MEKSLEEIFRDLLIKKSEEFFNDFDKRESKSLDKIKKIVEKVVDFLIKKYKNKRRIDNTHNLQHFYNVLNYSLKIIKNENLSMNEKEKLTLIVAILFHDIGLFFVEKPKDIEKSIEIFKKFYNELSNDERDLINEEEVIEAINSHSFKRNKKQKSLIAKILYDSDKLDVLGAYGFYRVCIYNEGKKLLFNPKLDYLDYLLKLKTNQLSREKCLEIFNDEVFVIDHYFTKIYWIKYKLNFEWSKKEAVKLENQIERIILESLEIIK
ncbi:MAG: HD domain-containing protein [Nanoarchaeota archaeon]